MDAPGGSTPLGMSVTCTPVRPTAFHLAWKTNHSVTAVQQIINKMWLILDSRRFGWDRRDPATTVKVLGAKHIQLD